MSENKDQKEKPPAKQKVPALNLELNADDAIQEDEDSDDQLPDAEYKKQMAKLRKARK